MNHTELERTAFVFTAKSIMDELTRLQDTAETKIRFAQANADIYGVIFYNARSKWLQELINFVEEKYKATNEERIASE